MLFGQHRKPENFMKNIRKLVRSDMCWAEWRLMHKHIHFATTRASSIFNDSFEKCLHRMYISIENQMEINSF